MMIRNMKKGKEEGKRRKREGEEECNGNEKVLRLSRNVESCRVSDYQ